VLIESALDEIDFGQWNGANFESLNRDPAWQVWNTDRAYARTPGGETMAEAQARIVDHLQWVQQRYPDGTVAIITHAEIIRAAWLHYTGRLLNDWQAVEIAPASVTRLELARMPLPETVLEAAAS
jgi:probable phosphoglycerate mutase